MRSTGWLRRATNENTTSSSHIRDRIKKGYIKPCFKSKGKTSPFFFDSRTTLLYCLAYHIEKTLKTEQAYTYANILIDRFFLLNIKEWILIFSDTTSKEVVVLCAPVQKNIKKRTFSPCPDVYFDYDDIRKNTIEGELGTRITGLKCINTPYIIDHCMKKLDFDEEELLEIKNYANQTSVILKKTEKAI